MAAAKPEAVTARLRHLLHSVCYKPNSITPAGSELVRSWFEAGSYQIPLHQLVRSWLRTSSEQASVMEFGFISTALLNQTQLQNSDNVQLQYVAETERD